MERRERLRKLLATMSGEQAEALGKDYNLIILYIDYLSNMCGLYIFFAASAADQSEHPHATMIMAPPKELFYTEGSEQLKAARIQVRKDFLFLN